MPRSKLSYCDESFSQAADVADMLRSTPGVTRVDRWFCEELELWMVIADYESAHQVRVESLPPGVPIRIDDDQLVVNTGPAQLSLLQVTTER